MPALLSDAMTDGDLWSLVCAGNADAFEVLVRRHQSFVCAVAYSCCGNLAQSEDVAQETFWAAWRDRTALAQPSRLRAWLCGIARNLGNNARRRAHPAQPVDPDLPSDDPTPEDAAVSREEAATVWQALEQIPDTYREPLVLYYREHLSVAETARSLDLSEDAVKQRLSRGREMLRLQVATLVEGVLRKSRPGKALTVAVMAGLTTLTGGAKPALAAAPGAAGVAAGVAGAGLAGATVGTGVGLLGGWLGTWLPAQLAPTNRERLYLLGVGLRMLLVSLVFTAGLVAVILAMAGTNAVGTYLLFLGCWAVAYWVYVAVESVAASRTVARIRRETPEANDPNTSPLRAGVVAVTSRHQGRVYRSAATLFGLPLIDINVRDPGSTDGPRTARGWLAVGDHARGVVAVGNTAVGVVAVGGRALGVVSLGGVAVGGIAFGGLAVGVLGVGGGALAVWALGGLAIGWDAVGGGAIAWHAAFGGGAAAHDYAVGGAAFASHANDADAKAVLDAHPLAQGMLWHIANQARATIGIVIVALGLPLAMTGLMYRRRQPTNS